MAASLTTLAHDFAERMPHVQAFSSVTHRQTKQSRIDAARIILASIAGSGSEITNLCREIIGPSAKEVASFAGKLMSKNPSSGTGTNTLAKATILQILVPFLNRRQMEECGIPVGQRAYNSAKSRNDAFTYLQIESPSGRRKHAASEDIVT